MRLLSRIVPLAITSILLVLLSCPLSKSDYNVTENNSLTDSDLCGPNFHQSGFFNCLPDKDRLSGQLEDECQKRGCCWEESETEDSGRCHHAHATSSLSSGYAVQSVKPTSSGGLEAVLVKEAPPSGFPDDVIELKLSVEFMGKNALRVKISDLLESRFQPPIPVLDLIRLQKDNSDHLRDHAYEVTVRSRSASFQVIRKPTGETLFDTNVSTLIFANQFLEISALLSSENLWGLGEHYSSFNKGSLNATYTIFNRGEPVPPNSSGMNLYGNHPFYVAIEKSGLAHGVFLLNSNAMDVVVQPSVPSLTYRTIGGVLDFWFFLGPSPDAVVSQYTALVGRPFLPPYWTLGFHLSRYGYNTTQETRDTWINNQKAGIPLDTMWSDIDYMDNMKDFTFNPVTMNGIGQLIKDLHKDGLHYVMNNSPGLSGVEPVGSYPPLDEANELDIFIRDYNGDVLNATVWQNVTHMLDFSNPKTGPYWKKNLMRFHKQVPFDASWIDMNEPYSFNPGSSTGCPDDNPLDFPPYVPGGGLIYNGTICLSAQQHLSVHYNLHNLFATMETIDTYKALSFILDGRRPFVLSRASSPGHGAFGAHWSGDIHSSWEHLRYSITNMLEFNLFGIPMVGSDICGFVGNTEEELCVRWMELGSFYPFSRNHNDFDTIPQDPASWSVPVQDMMRDVLKIRYHLLPHMYTQLYFSHVLGKPAVRPLFFDFPKDAQTYANDKQFLWGDSLMVIPTVEQGAIEVSAYLPAAVVWYDYYTGEALEGKGQTVTLSAPLGHISLLLKGGSVIPAQEPKTTTVLSRSQPFQLLVSLDKDGGARGNLYWDDGDSIDSLSKKEYNLIQFEVKNNKLSTLLIHRGYNAQKMPLSLIQIYGLDKAMVSVRLNDIHIPFQFNQTHKVLRIQLKDVSLLDKNTFTWS